MGPDIHHGGEQRLGIGVLDLQMHRDVDTLHVADTIHQSMWFNTSNCRELRFLSFQKTSFSQNQSNDMFSTLINKVILVPASSTQPYLKQLGKRIFSMIILGFGKLNVKSDIMLLRMIREIFDQYLPILITETSSGNFKVSDMLLKCFKEAKYELVRLIFEELMLHFYKISNDVMHKHSTLVRIMAS